MRVQPGDVVYDSKGRPGVVTRRDVLSGQVQAEAQGEKIDTARKYGFINGLTPEDRQQFYAIVDDINKLQNAEERVHAYSKQIEQLKEHPKNRHLVRYLTSEQAHLMFSENIVPKGYNLDENKTL